MGLALRLKNTASICGDFSGITGKWLYEMILFLFCPPFFSSSFCLSCSQLIPSMLLTLFPFHLYPPLSCLHSWLLVAITLPWNRSPKGIHERQGEKKKGRVSERLPYRFSFSLVLVNLTTWYHSSALWVCFQKQNKHSCQSPLLAVLYRARHLHTHTQTCAFILAHLVLVLSQMHTSTLWTDLYLQPSTQHTRVCISYMKMYVFLFE